MSLDIIESVTVIADPDRRIEATLWDRTTVTIHTEDSDDGCTDSRYDLDELRRIHAALGHLLWLAEN